MPRSITPRVRIIVNYLLKNYLELVFKSDISIALVAIPKFTFSLQHSSKRKVTSAPPPPLPPSTDTHPTVMEVVGEEYHQQEFRGRRMRREDRHAIRARVELMEKKKASSDKKSDCYFFLMTELTV